MSYGKDPDDREPPELVPEPRVIPVPPEERQKPMPPPGAEVVKRILHRRPRRKPIGPN